MKKGSILLLFTLNLIVVFDTRGREATFDFKNRILPIGINAPVFEIPLEGRIT